MWEGNLDPMNWSELPDGLWRLFLFSLWLGISMRMLIVTRADGILSSQPHVGSRSARLTPRASAGSGPSRAAWSFAWAIWGYGVLATFLSAFFNSETILELPWSSVCLLFAAGFLLLIAGPKAVNSALEEAEPMDSHGSDKLTDAYAVHRHLKVLGYYWISLGLVTWSTIFAVFAMWSTESTETIAVAGEMSALIIATASAGFGIQLVNGRATIRRLLAELPTQTQRLDGDLA